MVLGETWLEREDMEKAGSFFTPQTDVCGCGGIEIQHTHRRTFDPQVPFGGGSVMIWGCLSHDCKLDMVTVHGNLTGDRYMREILDPIVLDHFDNHPLATRPVYMDDYARPHRAQAVTQFMQRNAIATLPWPRHES